MSKWVEPESERWFFSRLRWRTLCGACGTPTGSKRYHKCGAAICPRHEPAQCDCKYALD